MKTTVKSILSLALLSAAALLCASAAAQETAPPAGVNHVIWIGSDGFGSHYVDWDELPNLREIRDNGSWTLHMRSVLPSASALNWKTMISGVPSEMHGFRTWGSKEPDIEPIYADEKGYYPDVFSVLKSQRPDARTTCVYDWAGIGYLYNKENVDDDVSITGGSKEVLETALKQLETKPTFAFIYFGDVDRAGHNIGWGTPEYHQAMVEFDDCVGKIRARIAELGMAEDTIVYISSDHGGSGKGHGEARLDHMESPYLVCGPGVKPGEITDVFVHFDCAATMAWLLGLEIPKEWRGVPAYSIVEEK